MTAALAKPGGDLRQGSGLFEHNFSDCICLGDQPDQSAIQVGDYVRLGTLQYQLHDPAAAQALDPEAQMMMGF